MVVNLCAGPAPLARRKAPRAAVTLAAATALPPAWPPHLGLGLSSLAPARLTRPAQSPHTRRAAGPFCEYHQANTLKLAKFARHDLAGG